MDAINEWLEEIDCEGQLEPISSTKSIIKYYRLKSFMHSGVVVDFSQKEEAFRPFLTLNLPLYEAGVTVPKIFTYNREEFFVFMEDLGSTHLCDIHTSDFELFYDKAIDAIVKIQDTEVEGLTLTNKMSLLNDIKLENILDKEMLAEAQPIIEKIVSELLTQPQEVFVHGDYQAKNLMFHCNDSIVVTEYHNAKVGAVTYDLASLLLDVHTKLDSREIERLALSFKDKKGLTVEDEIFLKWFYFSAMHRMLTLLFSMENRETITSTIKSMIEISLKYHETEALGAVLLIK